MPRQSAGILLYRLRNKSVEVLLVHPGGPFWTNKDEHAWSIPKGEFQPDKEDALAAARRELAEETGCEIRGPFLFLGTVRQSGGKVVYAWAVEGDCDASAVKSTSFRMEWPPRSGNVQTFPEIDQAIWFDSETARTKLHKGQGVLIDRLLDMLAGSREKPS